MTAQILTWNAIPEDHPIPLLGRKAVKGEQMYVARVFLNQGCHVASHFHVSEQTAIVLSGKVKWFFGTPGEAAYREEIVGAGQVVYLPSNTPHGVDALEDSVIIDVLSPPGPMGIDSQKG